MLGGGKEPRYRWWMFVLGSLGAALWFGLWPELEAMKSPPIPGEIVFEKERPPVGIRSEPDGSELTSSVGLVGNGGWSTDWLYDRFDDVMSWEHNPWRKNPHIFGSHYLELQGSSNPRDRARVLEIRRLGELLHQRVLERYPELAVPDKNVPDARNGFLKWLDFQERFDADPSRPGDRFSKDLGFPDELSKHLNEGGPWDAVAMKAWIAKERLLLDEVRAIGLMEEQSITGVDLERWHFMSAHLAKSCAEALLMDARLSAGEGNMAGALESVRAANGLADHMSQIETPSLLNATAEILIRLRVQKYVLSEIIPAVPAERFDAAAWEQAVSPTVKPPSEFGRLMIGEWNVTSRWWIMPMLSDANDPKYPSDPEALIDYHATGFTEAADAYSSQSPADWSSVGLLSSSTDTSHLSRGSRQLMEMMFIGVEAWGTGMKKSVHTTAMTQAAFAIMKGESVPNDPVHGLPYGWDPSTRTLSSPDSPEFREFDINPITVPSTGLR